MQPCDTHASHDHCSVKRSVTSHALWPRDVIHRYADGNALGRVCLSVCVRVCLVRVLTFESLETFICGIRGYILTISRSSSYIKVSGQGQGQGHRSVTKYIRGWSVFDGKSILFLLDAHTDQMQIDGAQELYVPVASLVFSENYHKSRQVSRIDKVLVEFLLELQRLHHRTLNYKTFKVRCVTHERPRLLHFSIVLVPNKEYEFALNAAIVTPMWDVTHIVVRKLVCPRRATQYMYDCAVLMYTQKLTGSQLGLSHGSLSGITCCGVTVAGLAATLSLLLNF